MADPFTAATAVIGVASSVAGGAMTAQGQLAAGESSSAMYKYKAGVAARNAQINRQNSDFALEAGESEAKRSGLTTGFTIARQKVAQSGSGFDVNSGSAAAVRDATRDIGIVDQNTIRTNAGRKALGYRNRAGDLDSEAGADLLAGDNAKTAASIASTGTLIGTAGSVASKWMQAGQVWGGGKGGVTTYDGDMNVAGWMR